MHGHAPSAQVAAFTELMRRPELCVRLLNTCRSIIAYVLKSGISSLSFANVKYVCSLVVALISRVVSSIREAARTRDLNAHLTSTVFALSRKGTGALLFDSACSDFMTNSLRGLQGEL